jgi:hypothetical protein
LVLHYPVNLESTPSKISFCLKDFALWNDIRFPWSGVEMTLKYVNGF